jgi:ABC-type branched-subunit amino acid transport system ATPase component
MLELDAVTGGYKDTRIVTDLSLRVAPGEVVGVLGRNGVGKTTLLKSVFGLCRRFDGEIRVDGTAVPPGRPELLARAGLTLMPDDRGVFANLTISENLRLATRRGYRPPVDVREVYPLLDERADQAAGTLSGRQKQQVGLARAVLAGSRLIAVDEFSQGLQPSLAQAALEALQKLAASGVTVVLVEQSPDLPLRYCHRLVGMLKGRVVFDEPVDSLDPTSGALNDLLVVN